MEIKVGKKGDIKLYFPRGQNWFEMSFSSGYTLLSVEDFDLVKERLIWVSGNGYPYAIFRRVGRRNNKATPLHRIVLSRMGINIKGKHVDHINRDKLDCRRENLRAVTVSENLLNSKQSDRAKFIYYSPKKKKWVFDFKRKGLRFPAREFCSKADAEKHRDRILSNFGER